MKDYDCTYDVNRAAQLGCKYIVIKKSTLEMNSALFLKDIEDVRSYLQKRRSYGIDGDIEGIYEIKRRVEYSYHSLVEFDGEIK